MTAILCPRSPLPLPPPPPPLPRKVPTNHRLTHRPQLPPTHQDTLPLLSVAFGDDVDSHAVQRGFAELPTGGYQERKGVWFYERLAVLAVTKAGAWQVACVAGAMGRWLSVGRGIASWMFLRFYLRRTYGECVAQSCASGVSCVSCG